MHPDSFHHGLDGVAEDQQVLPDGIVLAEVGEEIARIHAVQAVEEGVQGDLQVQDVHFRLFGLVRVVPCRQPAETFKDLVQNRRFQVGDDGDERRQHQQGVDQYDHTAVRFQYLDEIPHHIMAADLVQPLRLPPDQEAHEDQRGELAGVGAEGFWQLVKQVLGVSLPEAQQDLHGPQRSFGHAVIVEAVNQPCLFGGVEVFMDQTFNIFHNWQLVALQEAEEICRIQIHVWILHFPGKTSTSMSITFQIWWKLRTSSQK